SLSADQIQKRLQLLHDVAPSAKTFGLILNPDNMGAISSGGRTPLELANEAVRNWGVTLEVAHARVVEDLETAFATLVTKRIDALATASDALFLSRQERLVALAAQYAMPAVFGSAEAARLGGLVGYSASLDETGRNAGLYAGRILKGEKPADLPVLLPTKFELVINLRTARTLGLTISRELLLAADEVIE